MRDSPRQQVARPPDDCPQVCNPIQHPAVDTAPPARLWLDALPSAYELADDEVSPDRELSFAWQPPRQHEDAKGQRDAGGDDIEIETLTHRLIVKPSQGYAVLLHGRYSCPEEQSIGAAVSLLIRSTSPQAVVIFTLC